MRFRLPSFAPFCTLILPAVRAPSNRAAAERQLEESPRH